MQTLLGSNLCWLSSGGNCLPCKVAARVFRSPVRHSLLKVIMSASQHFEALVCHRKDRTAPASGLPQQVCTMEPSLSYPVHFIAADTVF